MKNLVITSMLVATTAMFLFTACDSKQPVDKLLENDAQRSEIMSSLINHEPYRMELVSAMMDNDSCRNLMGQKMMEKPERMGMEMKIGDPIKMEGTMNHMVTMAASDSTMFNAMIQMMKGKPEMWSRVMKMNSTTAKIN